MTAAQTSRSGITNIGWALSSRSRGARVVFLLAVAVACLLWITTAARAHPHVWVSMRSQIVYAPDGAIRGVRHSWTFDGIYSAFATQGITTKTKGVFTREDLAPLAEVNVISLQEFDYFTIAKSNGKRIALANPVDYWLDFEDEILTLHFTLPLKTPLKTRAFTVEIYDPVAFVDFAFGSGDAVTLSGAPASCKLSLQKPKGSDKAQALSLGEAFFSSLTRSSNWGAQLVNTITVQCP
jgi:ABC-type uncharacterized transport system substrate-binding protein